MSEAISPSAPAAQTDNIPGPRVARELIAERYTGRPATYDVLYRAMVNGRFPVEQTHTGRWSVRRADLPQVAAALGLTPAVPVPVPVAA